MPVPNNLSDLDTNPANNFPQSSESVFPELDDYLRFYASCIAELRDREENRWPVGSIYINASSSVNPGSFLPGTWTKVTNGVLYAHGAPDAGSLGNTGGASTVKLSASQMPSHKHSGSTNSAGGHSHTRGTMNITGEFGARKTGDSTVGSVVANTSGAFGASGSTGSAVGRLSVSASQDTRDKITFNAASSWSGSTSNSGSHTHSFTTGNAGNGAAHENKMPFLTVMVWKRVS